MLFFFLHYFNPIYVCAIGDDWLTHTKRKTKRKQSTVSTSSAENLLSAVVEINLRMASIHQVILDGRLSQLNLLINKLGCNVNEKDAYGRTPLHLAVLSDQERYGYRVARLLLQGSADINATDTQQQTPLVYACLLNRTKLVSLFLRTKSIDWRLTDHESYLVVHHAASSSQTSILSAVVQEMKSIGLSMDCKTEMGYTPLILAIKSSRFDNAMFLIDHAEASPFAIDGEYHLTCEQWLQQVEPKMTDWTYYFQKRHPTSKLKRHDRK